jgi:hypothetical protein
MICPPVSLACHLDNSILYIKYTLTYLVLASLTVRDISPAGYHIDFFNSCWLLISNLHIIDERVE